MKLATDAILLVIFTFGMSCAQIMDIYEIPVEKLPLTLCSNDALVKIDTMGFKRLTDQVFLCSPKPLN